MHRLINYNFFCGTNFCTTMRRHWRRSIQIFVPCSALKTFVCLCVFLSLWLNLFAQRQDIFLNNNWLTSINNKDWKNINVPQNIVDLEGKIEDVKNEKNKVVKSQKFEEAASLRDAEKRLQEDLEKAKGEWEEESKHKRFPIGEEDIAEVVSMMTGIPVKRMVQAET